MFGSWDETGEPEYTLVVHQQTQALDQTWSCEGAYIQPVNNTAQLFELWVFRLI